MSGQDADLEALARSSTDLYGLLTTPRLAVAPGSDDADLRRAYRYAALLHHPDKQRTDDPLLKQAAEQRFTQISQAYEVLSRAGLRHTYDQGVEAREAQRRAREHFANERRELVEELERAELNARGGESDDQALLKRLQAENHARMEAHAERKAKKVAEAEAQIWMAKVGKEKKKQQQQQRKQKERGNDSKSGRRGKPASHTSNGLKRPTIAKPSDPDRMLNDDEWHAFKQFEAGVLNHLRTRDSTQAGDAMSIDG